MRVMDEFTKQSGVIVDYTTIPRARVATTLESDAANNNLPDVAMLPQTGVLRDFACHGLLKPLPTAVQQAIADNYTNDRQKPGMYNGQLYGLWFKAANKSLIWYDAPVLRRAGVIEDPSSWTDFITAAEKVAASGVTPMSVAGQQDDAWVLTDWFENVYLRTAGPELYDRLAGQETPKTPRLPWTDPSVTTALQRLADLWSHQPGLIVGGAQRALGTTYAQSVDDVVKDKVAAMVFEGDFVAAQIPASDAGRLGKDIKFFPFPSIDNSPVSVIGAGDIAAMTKDTDGARQLMKFLASPAAAEIWARQGGFISPNRNVPVDVYPEDGVSRPSARAWSEATVIKYDLSDQLQPNLGSNPQGGLWSELRNFLGNPSDTAAADFGQRMEAAAQRNEADQSNNTPCAP